jgi:hypothetical protein
MVIEEYKWQNNPSPLSISNSFNRIIINLGDNLFKNIISAKFDNQCLF